MSRLATAGAALFGLGLLAVLPAQAQTVGDYHAALKAAPVVNVPLLQAQSACRPLLNYAASALPDGEIKRPWLLSLLPGGGSDDAELEARRAACLETRNQAVAVFSPAGATEEIVTPVREQSEEELRRVMTPQIQ